MVRQQLPLPALYVCFDFLRFSGSRRYANPTQNFRMVSEEKKSGNHCGSGHNARFACGGQGFNFLFSRTEKYKQLFMALQSA